VNALGFFLAETIAIAIWAAALLSTLKHR